ncbi:MAG: hypothetical protein WC460_04845 [Patescibacteria group bacterium]
MNNKENPIPISHGNEINIQKLIDTIKEKSSMLEEMHTDIVKQIEDKEALYNREFMKSASKINYGLIADLTEEIETLNDIEKKIFDDLLEAEDLLQEGAESLRDYQELSDLIEKITFLEKLLKAEPGNK